MNAGQFLSTLSGLSGVSAAQHLAAIQTGETRIAYRSDVHIEKSGLLIRQRTQDMSIQRHQAPDVLNMKSCLLNKYLQVTIRPDHVYVVTRTASLAEITVTRSVHPTFVFTHAVEEQ